MILNPILPALLSAPLPVLHLLLFLLLLLFFFMYHALALTAEWYPGALFHQQLSIRTLSKAMGVMISSLFFFAFLFSLLRTVSMLLLLTAATLTI